jgi:hypothetical protein
MAKLKKKPKKILVIILLILVLLAAAFCTYHFFFKKTNKSATVVNTIKDYNYTLKDNKDATYKAMFYKLETILKAKKVDEKAYAKQISKMFIYDFFTLSNKESKADIGGTDFVYAGVLDNFLENAEDTYYKYVESNIYGGRTQKLPTVEKVTIGEVTTSPYTYNSTTDDAAYSVSITWTYTSKSFKSYQSKATLIFVHNGKRLDLVELK